VSVKDEALLKTVCALFGNVDYNVIRNALQQRIFIAGVRGSSYTVPLSYSDAVENRDAFAKV
jgi:hypothetical protein